MNNMCNIYTKSVGLLKTFIPAFIGLDYPTKFLSNDINCLKSSHSASKRIVVHLRQKKRTIHFHLILGNIHIITVVT